MPAELYHFSSLSVLKSIIFNVDLSEFVTRFSFHFYGRVSGRFWSFVCSEIIIIIIFSSNAFCVQPIR